ncbi:hypothetical protein DMI65_07650 [Escherichia coli]|nr:hypothetical protein [Escherichia coli]
MPAVLNRHFANDFSVEHLFTSLEAMAENDAIDAVYIASRIPCTFPRHNFSLSHKIHVICEKPLASNLAEVDAAIACARENQVVLFEAFKTAYLPNFHLLRRGRCRKSANCVKSFSTIASIPRGISVTRTERIPTPSIRHSPTVRLWISAHCTASAVVALFGEPKSVRGNRQFAGKRCWMPTAWW